MVSIVSQRFGEHVHRVQITMDELDLEMAILDELMDVMFMDAVLDLLMGSCVHCECYGTHVVTVQQSRSWLG